MNSNKQTIVLFILKCCGVRCNCRSCCCCCCFFFLALLMFVFVVVLCKQQNCSRFSLLLFETS